MKCAVHETLIQSLLHVKMHLILQNNITGSLYEAQPNNVSYDPSLYIYVYISTHEKDTGIQLPYHLHAKFIIELYAIRSNKDRHDNSICNSKETTISYMVLGVINEVIVLGEIRDKGQ